jgi:sulfur-oxidizing protein SoxY
MQRRKFLKGFAGASAVATIVTVPSLLSAKDAPKIVSPNKMDVDTAMKAVIGGAKVTDSDKVTLTVPEIAENGAVVPVKVNVDHPMTKDSYVKSIHILAAKNQNSRCADVILSPTNGKGYFATRIKLGQSQDVIALVGLSDGTYLKAAKGVKVTIGGCG